MAEEPGGTLIAGGYFWHVVQSDGTMVESEHLARWQGKAKPTLDNPMVTIFAGNHGVTDQGVSAFPREVTAQMVANFTNGGAAISRICALHELNLRVFELALEWPTGDKTREAALDDRMCAATIAYGARNIPDLDALFSEMARVLKPDGVAVCLEIAQPTNRAFTAFYGLWFDKIVPRLGARISGDAWAYSYLPESVKEFVAPDELSDIMERNGLQDVTWRRLAGGIITLHRGTRRH
jgi:SAM-dependent methyltransferase